MFITNYGVQIGFAMNVVLLSFALADRINTMRNELQSLNARLESKVTARTSELQSALEELGAMNDILIKTNSEIEEAHSNARKDMSMAANIQSSLFPNKPPDVEGWDIAFTFKPMSGVSGDMFDFFTFQNRLRGAAIFDVSGHGVAPGLITMIARSVFYRNFNKLKEASLGAIMEKSNSDMIKEMGAVDNYLTGIILRFGYDTVEYVNAAHTDLVCKRADTGDVDAVNPDGKRFKGRFVGTAGLEGPYETVRFRLNRDDVLLLYTDCIYESKNSSGEEYGLARIRESFKAAAGPSANRIMEHILKDLYDFTGNRNLKDDLTLIVLKKTS
jgi:phosphoserine phosphatase RsbU/P